MIIKRLNKIQYIDSTLHLRSIQNQEFAQQALEYCDKNYGWEDNPCLCLESNKKDVCYLFYHLSKDKRYLVIDNLLTPQEHRHNGYAKHMLKQIFKESSKGSLTQRVKMFCVSSSLEFYMALGIDFWGVNEIGQYYTEFPLPKNGIDTLDTIMQNEDLSGLYKRELKTLYKKLESNGRSFDQKESSIFLNAKKILGDRYRFQELYDLVH